MTWPRLARAANAIARSDLADCGGPSMTVGLFQRLVPPTLFRPRYHKTRHQRHGHLGLRQPLRLERPLMMGGTMSNWSKGSKRRKGRRDMTSITPSFRLFDLFDPFDPFDSLEWSIASHVALGSP